MNKQYSVVEISSYKEEIKYLIDNYPDNYSRMITSKTRTALKEFIDSQTPLLQDSYYKLSTKCFWILHDLKDFPCCKTCGKSLKYNVKVNVGYGQFCSNSCAQKSDITQKKIRATKKDKYGSETYNNPEKAKNTCIDRYGVSNPNKRKETRDKIKNTCIKNYGVDHNFKAKQCIEKRRQTWIKNYGTDNPKSTAIVQQHYEETCMKLYGVKNVSQVAEIQNKKKKLYRFDNQWFDSSWELAFYIWHKDHHIKLIHEPEKLQYLDRYGNLHWYFPDFKIDDEFIEIKGNQFYDNTGHVLDEYKDKFDFMQSINVKILRYNDVKQYLTYINEVYGKDYLKQFRKRNTQ